MCLVFCKSRFPLSSSLIQKPSTNTYSAISFDLVTIRVGKSNHVVDILVYREILSSVSPYFHGAFEGHFQEATEGAIPLVDVTEQTFRVFLQWLHAQQHLPCSDVPVSDLSIIPSGTSVTPREPNAKFNTAKDVANDSGDDSGDDSDIATESSSKAFNEAGYHSPRLSGDQPDTLYNKNTTWMAQYNMTTISYLNLYTFADKYLVHQLRDDIMTALLGQANSWELFADPTPKLLTTAWEKLLASAKFQRWMVLSTAYYWATEPGKDLAIRLRSLNEWQPDFAFEVSLAQAQILQNKQDRAEGLAYYHLKAMPDSCVLHVRLVLSKDECRERIKSKAHVFAELVVACAKDGVAMAKQSKETKYTTDMPI
jgi:hypothetical protein